VTDAHGHAGPTRAELIRLASILSVITLIEFGIIYLQGMRGLVWAVLAVLSAVKFYFVASVFMHLKFEHKILAWVFAIGVFNAVWMGIALRNVIMLA
jgi:cytochrome c oxidase subunit IV